MIAPITDYAIKGAIWYQGESNEDRAVQYQAIFPAMIKDWRAQWGAGALRRAGQRFPFYFVQLANYKAPTPEAGAQNDPWVELQRRSS
ncbi:MAG: sialate O-acetylesterase [Verrucomicrobiales bacterium]